MDATEFAECCAMRRWFVDEGWISLQTSVDDMQYLAEHWGLVDEIGQDEVQRIIAEAFMPAEDLPSDYAAQLVMAWELDDPRDRWKRTGELPPVWQAAAIAKPAYRTPQSTIDAFGYVLSLGDGERLAAWLREHPTDAPALLETLEAA